MISHKKSCIFIHIPKTGGTSIEKMIWPEKEDKTEANLWKGFIDGYHNKYQTGGLQHLLASQVKQEVGDDIFNQYFKFTIVRNPWDKVISQYSYMKKRKDLRNFIGMEKDDCLKTYLSLITKKNHVQWEHQHKFVLDESQNIIVDYIGKFEEFNKDVYTILDKINIRTKILGIRVLKILHTNRSQERLPYSEYYDSESREMVANIYRKDIELFDYSF
ncbi:sulfotransferase family 2 domain-containing protein [Crocosphaera sp.]|uniref:sulfotransferase family 2 domain-containing protein n=1 Tax=Crocosphaera sp. TaxID=2729996 RepID=UPI003F257F50